MLYIDFFPKYVYICNKYLITSVYSFRSVLNLTNIIMTIIFIAMVMKFQKISCNLYNISKFSMVGVNVFSLTVYIYIYDCIVSI